MNILSIPKNLNRKIAIITDSEPDDIVALHLMASHYNPSQIALLGTTIMHAGRKKVLARRFMNQLGFNSVPVYQGSGGDKKAYYDTASSRPARTNQNEGKGILLKEQLKTISRSPHSKEELQVNIRKLLEGAEESTIDFFLLAPPTDLATVLKETPDLKERIGTIYVMGGWVDDRTTYNWNMDPFSIKTILQIQNIPIILLSSHIVRKFLGHGIICPHNYPAVITAMEEAAKKMASVRELFIACKNWNEHFISMAPSQLARNSCNLPDRYFLAADPLLVAMAINSEIVSGTTNVAISLDETDVNEKGYRVTAKEAPESNITLITDINIPLFNTTIIEGFKRLSGYHSAIGTL